MRRIAFFEDAAAAQFGPLVLLRPVFELLCGCFTSRERWIRCTAVDEWGAWMRPPLCESYALQHPQARLNDAAWLREAPVTFINGRWLPEAGPLPQLPAEEVCYCHGTLVAITIPPDAAATIAWENLDETLRHAADGRSRVDLPGTVIGYPWDLVTHNDRMLADDFHRRPCSPRGPLDIDHLVVQGAADDVHIDPTAVIDPFVVIDARDGPVWIDAGARVLPFTRIEGPAYIGRESQLFRAHVRRGTTIGPVCRVGGEVEQSILHGYVNKYHDGFLGHAYVCPWVNLGALTTNSDLKNDYSNVRVPLEGVPVDSGSTKVGCFIGDHTKTAIGTLINTGSTIGVMCLLLPSGELLPKSVPSFSRYWHGRLESPHDLLARSVASARIAMSRRNCELHDADERLLRHAFESTRAERNAALGRQRGSATHP